VELNQTRHHDTGREAGHRDRARPAALRSFARLFLRNTAMPSEAASFDSPTGDFQVRCVRENNILARAIPEHK